MTRTLPLQARAALVSLLILFVFGLAWHIGVSSGGGPAANMTRNMPS